MSLALLLKLVHVAAAFWLTTGIVGRYVVLARAERSPDIRVVSALTALAGVFEDRMVRPASGAVFLAGLVTAWVQGWPILGFLQGGRSNWVLVSILLFLTLIPLISLVFLPRGRVFAAALAEAEQRGSVTPALSAAFRDPLVRAAHLYELAALGVIIALMVLKPF